MSLVHQVWPKPSCKAQWNGEEDKADRISSRKTSGNGQAWSSPSPRGQWRTDKKWRKLVVKSSVMPKWPVGLRDRWWWWWWWWVCFWLVRRWNSFAIWVTLAFGLLVSSCEDAVVVAMFHSYQQIWGHYFHLPHSACTACGACGFRGWQRASRLMEETHKKN